MEQKTRKLGMFDCAFLLIGGMIGSAIFSLSGVTMFRAGPGAIIAWIIAGLILFAYGLINAELATVFPKSGGTYVFPSKALGKTEKQGKLWGWICCWAYLFGCIAGAAFGAIFISVFLGVSFPALGAYQVPLAVGAVVLCGILNVFNVRVPGKANTVISIVLITTLLAFVGIAFFGGRWNPSNFTPFFTQGIDGAFGFIGAIPIAMVAYGTIVAAAFMVGDINNPNRTVPRAMSIAMAVVITIYTLVIISTLGLITAGFLAENPGMVFIPLFAAAFTQLSHIPFIAPLISISALMALITTVLILVMLTSRVIQAAAIGGILPKFFEKNNEKTGTPVRAVALMTIIIGALAAFPNLVSFIVDFGALCNAIVIMMICITVIYARKKNPDAGFFKAPGGNALPIITMIVIASTFIPGILEGGWMLWAWTGGYYVVGMIIYYISTKRRVVQESKSKT